MSMKNSGLRRRARQVGGGDDELRARSSRRARRRPRRASTRASSSAIGAAPKRAASSRARPRAAVGDVRDRGAARREVRRRRARRSARRRPAARAGRARSPKTCCASAAAAAGTDAGLSPIAVSVRTRLPIWSAWRKTRSSSGPGDARLVGALHLAEDLALAGHERVEPGRDAEEVHRRGLVVHAVDDRRERLAGELLERRERALVAAARRGRARCGCRSRGRRRRRARARARPRGRTAARRARAARPARRGARCRRATASKVAPGERDADDDHEREARQRDVARRGGPSGRARRSAVDEPGRASSPPSACRRSPPCSQQADDPDREPEREQRQRDRDRCAA